ncbi:hypothetical protein KUCAC02_033824 [Chaenocephalus aceratus]|nr:hypothetical protein KUCAC02_033824 [Chaenocephalus aceratus]
MTYATSCLNYVKELKPECLRIHSFQDDSSGTKTSSQKDASHFMSPDSGPVTLGFMCVPYSSHLMGVTLGDAGSASLLLLRSKLRDQQRVLNQRVLNQRVLNQRVLNQRDGETSGSTLNWQLH